LHAARHPFASLFCTRAVTSFDESGDASRSGVGRRCTRWIKNGPGWATRDPIDLQKIGPCMCMADENEPLLNRSKSSPLLETNPYPQSAIPIECDWARNARSCARPRAPNFVGVNHRAYATSRPVEFRLLRRAIRSNMWGFGPPSAPFAPNPRYRVVRQRQIPCYARV
jgi:hypothetical protein